MLVLANKDTLRSFSDLHDKTKWYYFDMVEAITEHDFKKLLDVEKWTVEEERYVIARGACGKPNAPLGMKSNKVLKYCLHIT